MMALSLGLEGRSLFSIYLQFTFQRFVHQKCCRNSQCHDTFHIFLFSIRYPKSNIKIKTKTFIFCLSVGYVFMYLVRGELPWMNQRGEDYQDRLAKILDKKEKLVKNRNLLHLFVIVLDPSPFFWT